MMGVTWFFVLLVFARASLLAAQEPDAVARVDRIFARWTQATPGCAVGVVQAGGQPILRAYGMADLEHDIPNTSATIFEAGSVSKQFTAAAILLLEQQGKLSLDDDVRKYIPELPDYGTPITIRHMMTHTSGLRDWGALAGIAGWPRGQRAHTHAHVVEILTRQRGLNFTPGSEYSYSNSGYNLQVVIVDRVSGMSFADFTRKHIFEPLGMKHTQWRDDYTRIVKGRAQAYANRRGGEGFTIDMPFENVHGNGGLLTTVGDLLIWNENLNTGQVGGGEYIQASHRRMRLNNGREISYAGGLMVGEFNGFREVSHTGSTAGYRAFLARYPEQKLSVALLCNAGSVNPGVVGHEVASVFLPAPARTAVQLTPPTRIDVPATYLTARVGLYRDALTYEPARVTFLNGALRLDNTELVPVAAGVFQSATGRRFLFPPEERRSRIRAVTLAGDTTVYEPVAEYSPTPEQLAQYVGEYYSPDAEVALHAVVEDGQLVLRRKPNTRMELTPQYEDVFEGQLGMVRFIRDANGKITELSVRQGRVYDLRFSRAGN